MNYNVIQLAILYNIYNDAIILCTIMATLQIANIFKNAELYLI